MNAALLSCTKCLSPLPPEQFAPAPAAPTVLPDPVSCPACGAWLQIEAFPALFRPVRPGSNAEIVLEDTESACFYHPQKKAVVPCDACGRFLCALCDCDLNGQHLCPSCLEAGKKKGKIRNLENQRVCYDKIAFALAVLPILVFYFTVVTAPLVIFLAVRHWNTPSSILRRTRIWFVLAVMLAGLEIAGWVVVAYLFASGRFHLK